MRAASLLPLERRLLFLCSRPLALNKQRDSLMAYLKELQKSHPKGKTDENLTGDISRLDAELVLVKDDLVRPPAAFASRKSCEPYTDMIFLVLLQSASKLRLTGLKEELKHAEKEVKTTTATLDKVCLPLAPLLIDITPDHFPSIGALRSYRNKPRLPPSKPRSPRSPSRSTLPRTRFLSTSALGSRSPTSETTRRFSSELPSSSPRPGSSLTPRSRGSDTSACPFPLFVASPR